MLRLEQVRTNNTFLSYFTWNFFRLLRKDNQHHMFHEWFWKLLYSLQRWFSYQHKPVIRKDTFIIQVYEKYSSSRSSLKIFLFFWLIFWVDKWAKKKELQNLESATIFHAGVKHENFAHNIEICSVFIVVSHVFHANYSN